jgi:hypothetical protein
MIDTPQARPVVRAKLFDFDGSPHHARQSLFGSIGERLNKAWGVERFQPNLAPTAWQA